MSVIWEKRNAEKAYQVRRAGNSIRLYTDGTFHSQYNPNFPLGGTIWDLLLLPALFRPASIKRVLVLGVGGGAVIRQLLDLVNPQSVTGIELDPVHIAVAKQYFGLGGNKAVCLRQADAVDWLGRYRGKPFDLIVDDLFVENKGDPRRAVPVQKEWARLLSSHLNRSGVLAVNFEAGSALRSSALLADPALAKQFPGKFSLSVPGYDNRIGAFFRSEVTKSDLKASLQGLEKRFGKKVTSRLAARVRKLQATKL